MILIVDDKPENILSLKSILEMNKIEVDTALSGEEALKKILKQTYALIILDVQMPGMDGFEVAEAISSYSRSKHTPIIFLSAVSTHKRFIAKGLESGAIDYLVKPVDPDLLILRVKTLQRLFEQSIALNESQKALQAEILVRREAEQALQATVQELHTTLESIPQIAFTASADGHIDFVNRCWFDYSTSASQFPDSGEAGIDLKREWQTAIALGRNMELEAPIRKLSSGALRYHLLRVAPVYTAGEIVKWVGTFTDIHEQKMLNEVLEKKVEERTQALIATNKELAEKNDDLQQFTTIASHDLKEPLRKIQFFSGVLEEQLSDSDALAKRNLAKINQSANRMSRLIDDVLNFSRLSEASLFERVDLNVLMEELLSDLEVTIAEKKAGVEWERLPVLEANPGLLRQVLQNLLSNALKFSKPDLAPRIKLWAEQVNALEVESEASADGQYWRIYISDNGIGFDQKYLNKIFSIFQRLHTRDTYEGTGMGLAITKKIIQKHHGLITATSALDGGATFILVLPAKQSLSPAAFSPSN